MSANLSFPFLSHQERDRRFELTRSFMRETDLDVMILGQVGGRIFQYFSASQQYLSNEPNGQNAIVIFPRDSDPVLLVIRTQWGQIWEDERKGLRPWIDDYRLSENVSVTDVLTERRLDSGRAGLVFPSVAGTAYGPRPVGSLGDPLWSWISSEFPKLEGVDALMPYSLKTMVKSPEEIDIARYNAHVSDRAAQAFAEAGKPGASEVDMYAAAMTEYVQAGVDCQNIIMVRGNQVAGMGSPRWLMPNGPIKHLERGDVIINEMFPVYAGIETQLSQAVHVGEPSEEALFAHKVCQDAHAACMSVMRPGMTFQQVWQAMFDVVRAAGCWNWTPLIHSLSPMSLVGQQHHGLEGRTDIPSEVRLPAWPPAIAPHLHTPLEPGMLFSVEPGAAIGRHRSRTGCLALVTESGAEALTSFGTHLHVNP